MSFDDGLEVRSVFFDISKAFDRIWHKGFLHKLKSTCVSGELLLWFKNYLTGRKQRVVLPGANGRSCPLGCHTDQYWDRCLFINGIVSGIGSNICPFADDPTIDAVTLQSDIDKVSKWADKWHVDFNPSKSKCLLISLYTTVFKYHLPLITNI